jgi:hypothetical protein
VIEVYPNRVDYALLLTALTPISHHDPAVQGESNALLFNRQKQLLSAGGGCPAPEPDVLAQFAAAHPVPVDIGEMFADLIYPEFVGVVLVRLFLDSYNHGDGTGIFEGMTRYNRLEERLRHAAISSHTLRRLWDRLCDSLRVPIHRGDDDFALLSALTLPAGVQQAVLRAIQQDYRSIVAIARLWHSVAKLENPAYAEAAGQEATIYPKQVIQPEWSEDHAGAQIVEVPAISANSLRHQLVREPGWLGLFGALGLREARPGLGPVPAGVEALFYNGGNIAAGAKQPANTFTLASQIREAFPLLDLVGGVTDSFDVGESRLQVGAWLVCRENAPALAGTPAADLPAVNVSVFDLLDEVTITRQAGQVGSGQMIVNAEALAAGTQVYVRLSLAPFTRALTHGALVDAIDRWRELDGTVGGAAARGMGHCQSEWLSRHSEADAYAEAYRDDIEMRRDALVEALVSGRMGTGKVVLT